MKYFLSLLIVVAAVLTIGCAKAADDIPYGIKAYQKLNIYQPESDNAPVVVFYHGGRWTHGTKEDHAFVAEILTRRGFVVVIPDYAKYPAVRFPVFVADAAKALVWVYRNIEKYNGDPDRIYVAGHSAGAHIAALLASDQRYLNAEGETGAIIKAFAGLAGPYDFTPDDPDLKNIFGPPAAYPQMQVTNFIDGDEPPMLLLHGLDDHVVHRSNLDRLEKRIREKGGIVKTKFYPGIDHGWIVGSLSWEGRNRAPVAQDMIEFFNAYGTQKQE